MNWLPYLINRLHEKLLEILSNESSYLQIFSSARRSKTVVSVQKFHSAIQSINALRSEGFVNTFQPFGKLVVLIGFQPTV